MSATPWSEKSSIDAVASDDELMIIDVSENDPSLENRRLSISNLQKSVYTDVDHEGNSISALGTITSNTTDAATEGFLNLGQTDIIRWGTDDDNNEWALIMNDDTFTYYKFLSDSENNIVYNFNGDGVDADMWNVIFRRQGNEQLRFDIDRLNTGDDVSMAISMLEDTSTSTYMRFNNLGNTDVDILKTLDMNTNYITNVIDPVVDQDAATKKYVDDNSADASTVISSVDVTTAGSGYTDSETVTFTGQTSGATNASGTISTIDGVLASVIPNANGEEYVSEEIVTLKGDTSGAENATATVIVFGGQIIAFFIEDGGSGYQSGEDLTVVGGSGTGATATITTLLNGGAGSITVTDGGDGYSDGEMVSILGTGTGAVGTVTTTGVVIGANSSEDDQVSVFDGTSGKIIKTTPVKIDSEGTMTNVLDIDFSDRSTQNRGATPDDMLANANTISYQKQLEVGSFTSETGVGTGGIDFSHNGDYVFIANNNAREIIRIPNSGVWEIDDTLDGGLTEIVVTNGGTGYTDQDNVGFTGATAGTGARGDLNVTGGVITSITITDAGIGYIYGDTLNFTGTTGSGGTATAETAVQLYPIPADSYSNAPLDVKFRNDGKTMYISKRTASASSDSMLISQYSLETPWDLTSTITLEGSFETTSGEILRNQLQAFYISPDGKNVICSITDGTVDSPTGLYEFVMQTPWDITSIDETIFGFYAYDETIRGIHIRVDGALLHLCNRSNSTSTIDTFRFGVPWDIATLELKDSIDVSDDITQTIGIYANPGATRFYLTGTGTSNLAQFALGLNIEGIQKKMILGEDFRLHRNSIDASYTVTDSDYLIGVNNTSAAVTITLDSDVADKENTVIIIKDEGATDTITIDPDGRNVDGSTSNITLDADNGSLYIYSDGTDWWSVG